MCNMLPERNDWATYRSDTDAGASFDERQLRKAADATVALSHPEGHEGCSVCERAKARLHPEGGGSHKEHSMGLSDQLASVTVDLQTLLRASQVCAKYEDEADASEEQAWDSGAEYDARAPFVDKAARFKAAQDFLALAIAILQERQVELTREATR